MTLVVAFHHSPFPNFKAFSPGFVCQIWQKAFPGLVSYSRFIKFVPSVFVLFTAYLKYLRGSCHGISFLDSTVLAVCHNRRIHQHRVKIGIS